MTFFIHQLTIRIRQLTILTRQLTVIPRRTTILVRQLTIQARQLTNADCQLTFSNSDTGIPLKFHAELFNCVFDGRGVINADILAFGTPDAIAGNHYALSRAGIFVQNFPRRVIARLQSDSA